MLSNYLMCSTKAHVCKTFAFLVLKFDVLSALTMNLVMFVSALGSLLGLLLLGKSPMLIPMTMSILDQLRPQ